MAGIVSYGAYVPIYRLAREEIARAWVRSGGEGERSVANWDEDSITMAVEATLDCIRGKDRDAIDALYFASPTSPYRGKMSASIVAAACDLREDILIIDFSNSTRSGLNAIQAALDAVASGSKEEVVVAIADCQTAVPESELETTFGDGAAAFLIGNSNVAVTVEDSYSVSSPFSYAWRREEDAYPETTEARFAIFHSYDLPIKQAISNVMKRAGLTSKNFSKAVFSAPTVRSHQNMARSVGLDVKAQLQSLMFHELGDTGAALAPMMLISALEQSRSGDRILFAGYGDGAEAHILQVTEEIENLSDRRGVSRNLASKMMLPSYEKYLRFRNLLAKETDRRTFWEPDRTSLPVMWREQKQILNLHGSLCRHCGNIQFPIQRLCAWCQAKDDYDEVRLSDKTGKIFTFSMDE